MFFLPVLFLFLLWLPFLFGALFFHLLEFGFESLGISAGLTFILLLFIILGSFINIPISKRRYFYFKEKRFFGLINREKMIEKGIFINLGGGLIPILISLYLLIKLPSSVIPSVFLVTGLMITICYSLAKPIPGVGITIPAFLPPLFATIFSLLFAYHFAAPCAFISGVLGTLIGADVLHLSDVKKYRGALSIGGAGVFDGIFLTAIISASLAAL